MKMKKWYIKIYCKNGTTLDGYVVSNKDNVEEVATSLLEDDDNYIKCVRSMSHGVLLFQVDEMVAMEILTHLSE